MAKIQRASLRELRKRVQRIRVTAALGPDAYDALVLLMEKQTNLNISQIIADCIKFSYANGIFETRVIQPQQFVEQLGQVQGLPKTSSKQSTVAIPKKEQWCIDCGGEADTNMCRFNKYEVTATGYIVRNQISVPLRSMPEDEVDFRKSVLGGFATLGEAEIAFEKQDEVSIFDESEIPSRKKVEKN